jgi:hypothetical protein
VSKRLIPVFAVCLLAGCNGCESTDSKTRQAQEALQAEGDRQAGLPNIVNFQEKKLVKLIYELRDQENLVTWVYTQALDGRLVFLFKAIGYGVPYSAQYSNPQKIERDNGTRLAMPQAEPNGLFTPPSTEGTWLMAIGPDGKPHPVYVEPRVIVSPFPLTAGEK